MQEREERRPRDGGRLLVVRREHPTPELGDVRLTGERRSVPLMRYVMTPRAQ
jgi:hypothetical protein